MNFDNTKYKGVRVGYSNRKLNYDKDGDWFETKNFCYKRAHINPFQGCNQLNIHE